MHNCVTKNRDTPAYENGSPPAPHVMLLTQYRSVPSVADSATASTMPLSTASASGACELYLVARSNKRSALPSKIFAAGGGLCWQDNTARETTTSSITSLLHWRLSSPWVPAQGIRGGLQTRSSLLGAALQRSHEFTLSAVQAQATLSPP